MSEFKGTKGKWGIVTRFNNGHVKITANQGYTHLSEVILDPFSDDGEEECLANALLISKAPDMLEMLIELEMEAMKTPSFPSERLQRLKKLIKEATQI